MPHDRDDLRTTFERAAEHYDRARPAHPEILFDELILLTGVSAGDRVLEIGCAIGTATRSLASRGLRITGVELGADLAAHARRNLASFSGRGRSTGDLRVMAAATA